MNLTDKQRRAITHEGRNLQIIACAGSGKTEVVARRVVHLLSPGKGGGLAPRNIIAFTFTDKAAAELKERKTLSGQGDRRHEPRGSDRCDRPSNERSSAVLEGCMKINYDARTDTLTVILCDAPVAESDEDKPGVILDYDDAGNLVSIEVLDASTRVQEPRSVTLATQG